jgi:hypothetical protein
MEKRKGKDLILSLLVFWVLIYLFFALVYWSPNPMEWNKSGWAIAIIFGGFGTKNEIYG